MRPRLVQVKPVPKVASGPNGVHGEGVVSPVELDVTKGCAEFSENRIQVGFPAGDLRWRMGAATMVNARQLIAGLVIGLRGRSVKL